MPTPAVITCEESLVGDVCKLKFAWTSSDLGAGSFATAKSYFAEVLAIRTVPAGGGSAPTNLYDITMLDAEGLDVLLGVGADRSSANAENAAPATKSVAFGVLTFTLANAGNAKGGTAVVYLKGIRQP